MIDQGWAHYWGTSEWSAEQIAEAWAVAQRLGLIGPGAGQGPAGHGGLVLWRLCALLCSPLLSLTLSPAAAMEQPQYNLFHRK